MTDPNKISKALLITDKGSDFNLLTDAPEGQTDLEEFRKQRLGLVVNGTGVMSYIRRGKKGQFVAMGTDRQRDNRLAEESLQKTSRDDMDIRSLAREARQARELGDKTKLLTIEDEIQERLIRNAEQSNWDNERSDAALQSFIDIIYNEEKSLEPTVKEEKLFEEPEVLADDLESDGIPFVEGSSSVDQTGDRSGWAAWDNKPFVLEEWSKKTTAVLDRLDRERLDTAFSDSDPDSKAKTPNRVPFAPIQLSNERASSKGEKKLRLRRRIGQLAAGLVLGVTVALSGIGQGDHDRNDNSKAMPVGDTPTEISLDAEASLLPENVAYEIVDPTQIVPTPEVTVSLEPSLGATEIIATTTATPTPESTETPAIVAVQPTVEATAVIEQPDAQSDLEVVQNNPDTVTGIVASTPEVITPADIYPEMERTGIEIEVAEGDGITHVLQKYVAENYSIAINGNESYQLYSYLESNPDFYDFFENITFFTLPNGDVGIIDEGPGKITPKGQDAISVWIENVLPNLSVSN